MAAVKIYLPHSLFALAHWASFPNLIRFFKFGAHLCCGPGTLGPQEMGGFFPWLERWFRSVVKSPHCFYRGPKFGFEHPCQQLTAAPNSSLRDLMPSSGLHSCAHTPNIITIKHLFLKGSKPLPCSTAHLEGSSWERRGWEILEPTMRAQPLLLSLSLLACSPSDARSAQGSMDKTSCGLWQKSIPLAADSPCSGVLGVASCASPACCAHGTPGVKCWRLCIFRPYCTWLPAAACKMQFKIHHVS